MPTKRVCGVLGAFLLACVLGGAGTAATRPAATANPAKNSTTYRDGRGEDKQAPDITRIRVSNTDWGLISFRIDIPNRRQLTGDMFMELWVDSDENARTGSPSLAGVDYVIQIVQGEINLYHWDGTNFTRRMGDPSATTVAYVYKRGAATITISAAELGNTHGFRFLADVASGIVIDQDSGAFDDTNGHVDVAPSAGGGGLYAYNVKQRPPKLVVKKLVSTPSKPTAGDRFSLRLSVARSDSHALLKDGQVTCVGRVGGTAIRALANRFAGTDAICTWLLPSGAKGERFTGKIAVVFEGIRVARGVSAGIG
jgi:hypothetical protein